MPPPSGLQLWSKSARSQKDLDGRSFPPHAGIVPDRECLPAAPAPPEPPQHETPDSVLQLALRVAQTKESVQFFIMSDQLTKSTSAPAAPTFIAPSPRPRPAASPSLTPRTPSFTRSPPSPTPSSSPSSSMHSDSQSDASTASTCSRPARSASAKRRVRANVVKASQAEEMRNLRDRLSSLEQRSSTAAQPAPPFLPLPPPQPDATVHLNAAPAPTPSLALHDALLATAVHARAPLPSALLSRPVLDFPYDGGHRPRVTSPRSPWQPRRERSSDRLGSDRRSRYPPLALLTSQFEPRRRSPSPARTPRRCTGHTTSSSPRRHFDGRHLQPSRLPSPTPSAPSRTPTPGTSFRSWRAVSLVSRRPRTPPRPPSVPYAAPEPHPPPPMPPAALAPARPAHPPCPVDVMSSSFSQQPSTAATPAPDLSDLGLPPLAATPGQDMFFQAVLPHLQARVQHYKAAAAAALPPPAEPSPAPAPPCTSPVAAPVGAQFSAATTTPPPIPGPPATPGSSTSMLLGLSCSLSESDSPPGATTLGQPHPAGPSHPTTHSPRLRRPAERLRLKRLRAGTTSPDHSSDTPDDLPDRARSANNFVPSPPRHTAADASPRTEDPAPRSRKRPTLVFPVDSQPSPST